MSASIRKERRKRTLAGRLQGDLRGGSLGRVIGAAVWTKAKTYFDGTAYRGEAVSTSRPHPSTRTLSR